MVGRETGLVTQEKRPAFGAPGVDGEHAAIDDGA